MPGNRTWNECEKHRERERENAHSMRKLWEKNKREIGFDEIFAQINKNDIVYLKLWEEIKKCQKKEKITKNNNRVGIEKLQMMSSVNHCSACFMGVVIQCSIFETRHCRCYVVVQISGIYGRGLGHQRRFPIRLRFSWDREAFESLLRLLGFVGVRVTLRVQTRQKITKTLLMSST